MTFPCGSHQTCRIILGRDLVLVLVKDQLQLPKIEKPKIEIPKIEIQVSRDQRSVPKPEEKFNNQ